MIKKSILIHGPLNDLGDLLSIARAEGSKVLGCEKVSVSPQVISVPNSNDFVVIVSPKEMVVRTSQVACEISRQKHE